MKLVYKPSLLLIIAISAMLFLSIESYAQGARPVQSEPDSASVCNFRQIVFDWELVPNASDYRLQVTTVSGSYTDPVIDSSGITSTSQFIVLPDNDQTYYWRVAARFSTSFNYSNEWPFETTEGGPVLLSPANQAQCVDNEVSFTWEPAQSADSYNIQVSSGLNFANLVHDVSNVSGTTTELLLEDGYSNYYWRVSYNYENGSTNCVSEWSEIRQLRTTVSPPVVTAPVDGEKAIPFNYTIKWENATGATDYDLQVSESNTFGTLVFGVNATTNNQYSATFQEQYNTEYFLRMRSNVSGTCTSDWSDAISFKTPYAKAIQVSPTDEVDCYPVENVMFDWNAVSGAQAYTLVVALDEELTDIVFDIDSIATDGFEIDMPGDLTTYFWSLRAEDSLNTGIWSDTLSFTTGIFDPILLSPEDDEAEVFINAELSWTSQSNFSQYDIQVSKDENFTTDSLILDETGLIEETAQVLLPEYGTRYYWRVSSTFGACLSNWSEVSSFISMRGYPDLTSPENNVEDISTNVNFKWEPVEGAVSYDIEIAYQDDFDIIEFGRLGIEETNISVNLIPERTYYWRVRTNTGFSKSPWSAVFRLITGVAPAGIPQLSYPTDRSEMIPTDVTMEWLPQEGAESYNLQVSTDNDFGDFVIEESGITDTLYSASDLVNFENYYWRVQAVNSSGTTNWSTPWRFRVIASEITDAVIQRTPQNGDSEVPARSVTLGWFEKSEAEDYDGGYHLQFGVSETFNEADLLIDSRNIWDPERVVNDLDDNTTYWWRVRGWNEVGDGPWSESWSFTTVDLTSINEPEFIDDVNIYPNPVEDRFVIDLDVTKTSELSIEIYDLTGVMVLNPYNAILANGSQSIQIEGLNLQAGTYFVYIRSGNGASVKQIVINK